MKKIFAIGTTHFDPVWLWQYDEALSSIRATFRSALDRMDEYPEFIYSFCCPPVFDAVKRIDPALFLRIKKRVEEGRWELNEGWWLQPDTNAPSGESLVRQGLYGQKYLMDNFGIKSESAFNTDSFGHNAALPQILSKSGIKNYIFMRPHEKEMSLPPLFNWQGIDGSSVAAYRFFNEYTDDGKESVRRAEECGLDYPAVVYGVTDHGGAPTKKSIEFLRERAELSSVKNFFKAQAAILPEINGELQGKDFGVYINVPEIKINNRKCEYALLNAEKAAVWAQMNGLQYPHEKLNALWHDTLFNQFHDILGGACIKDAFADARDRHGRALMGAREILQESLQYIAKDVFCGSKFWNLVMFNLNPSEFDGYAEAEVQCAWEFEWYKDGIELIDDTGARAECQVITEKSVLPGFRSRFVFRTKIPALSYRTYEVVKTGKPLAACTGGSENDSIKSVMGKNGVSISDIKSGGVLTDIMPVVFQDDGDTWCFNQTEGYKGDFETMELVSDKTVEYGNLKQVYKRVYKYRDSQVTQFTDIYAGCRHADFRYAVDWREKHKVLKIRLPLSGAAVTAGIPYGTIERAADGRERTFSEFIKTDKYSLFSGSAFSYHAKGGELFISLLRSAIYGDLRLFELDGDKEYDYMSQGISEFSFRVSFDTSAADAQRQSFANAPVCVIESWHGGAAKTGCLGQAAPNLSALKAAEKGDGIVARFAETTGKHQEYMLGLQGYTEIAGKLKPFEIKTVLMKKNEAYEVNMLEEKL